MKTQRAAGRFLALALSAACLLGAAGGGFFTAPALAAEEGQVFRYEHSPLDNEKAMADIIVNPAAVYGFSPNPESGSLKAYAAFDWTDPAVVEEGRQERLNYHRSIQEMYGLLEQLRSEGKGIEEIARTVSARRNEIRLAESSSTPEQLAAVKARNLEKYGHEEGPDPDWLFERYGSWETVIEKAFSVNSGMDACVGLYDDFYGLYVAAGQIPEVIDPPATREFTAAAFVQAAELFNGASTDILRAFTDGAEVSEVYEDNVAAAVYGGILNGYSDETLRPQGTVTRLQALVMLSRCLPETAPLQEPEVYPDVPQWAREAIDRLSRGGFLRAREDGTLGTDELLTVNQVELLAQHLGDLLLLKSLNDANAGAALLEKHTTLERKLLFAGQETPVRLFLSKDLAVREDGAKSQALTEGKVLRLSPEGQVTEEAPSESDFAAARSELAAAFALNLDGNHLTHCMEQSRHLYAETTLTRADLVQSLLTSMGQEYREGASLIFSYTFNSSTLEAESAVCYLHFPGDAGTELCRVEYAYDKTYDTASSPFAAWFAPAGEARD